MSLTGVRAPIDDRPAVAVESGRVNASAVDQVRAELDNARAGMLDLAAPC